MENASIWGRCIVSTHLSHGHRRAGEVREAEDHAAEAGRAVEEMRVRLGEELARERQDKAQAVSAAREVSFPPRNLEIPKRELQKRRPKECSTPLAKPDGG